MIATITDGDIRRYLSKGGKVDDPIILSGNKKFHYLDKNSTLNKKIREFENFLYAIHIYPTCFKQGKKSVK